MHGYRSTLMFWFNASHQLTGVPDSHRCARLHGHTYRVDLIVESRTLDAAGQVFDEDEFAPFIAQVKGWFDGRHINNVIEGNPTPELLARFIYEEGAKEHFQLAAVRVSERPQAVVEYRESSWAP